MMVLKYWGLMMVQLYSIFWVICACTASVDLTLIGHLKGWKRIRYPKWIGGAIDKKRRYGYELVSDWNTHPQVLWFLFGALLLLFGVVGLIVGVWQFVNDVDAWVLWLIDAGLYIPTIIFIVVLKVLTKRAYFLSIERDR